MLGVRKVRSHSCKCIEQSSLLLLSKTAFRALVEKTGRNRTEQNMVGLAGLGDMVVGFSPPVVRTCEHSQNAQLDQLAMFTVFTSFFARKLGT